MHSSHERLPENLQDTPSYIIAHMSTPEVEELAKIQGGKVMDHSTGYPSFLPLGEVLSHRGVIPHVENFKRDYMAKNYGSNGIEDMIRKSGRYGDTEAVILPRHLADLFDSLLYGGKQPGNPKTGKREYFLGGFLSSLGNLLSPIGNMIGGAIKSFAPQIGQFASPLIQKGVSALGQKAGLSPELSQSLGEGVSGIGTNLLNNYAAQGQEGTEGGAEGGAAPTSSLDILKQGAGDLLNRSLPSISNYAQGKATELGNKISPTAGTAIGNLTGNLLNNVGGNVASNLQQGQTPTASGMGNSALDALTSSAKEQLPNLVQNPMGRAAGEGAINAFENYRGGASPMDAIQQGVQGISPETMQGAQSYASNGISSILDELFPMAEEALPLAAAL